MHVSPLVQVDNQVLCVLRHVCMQIPAQNVRVVDDPQLQVRPVQTTSIEAVCCSAVMSTSSYASIVTEQDKMQSELVLSLLHKMCSAVGFQP